MPTEEQIMKWQPDRKKGFILEVDLEYPQELHDKHNSYPLAPENTQVPDEWLPPYQKSLARDLGLSKDRTKKLLLTLRDKKKYVFQYRNFRLYLKLGIKLKKVHNVLSFDQKDWMEPYIRLNTELRKKAASDFEKELFQADEQLSLWQDDGKPQKPNRCKSCTIKRGGKASEANIPSTLRKSSCLRRKSCRHPDARRQHPDEQTSLHRHVRA